MGATTNPKLSPQAGKVAANAMSSRKGNDSKLPSAESCSPSASLTLSSSPVSRWRLLARYKHGVQCRTPRGAIVSMGLRGSPGGLRGEIEISPSPLAKKVINQLVSLLFISTPQSRLTPCQLPVRGAFWMKSLLRYLRRFHAHIVHELLLYGGERRVLAPGYVYRAVGLLPVQVECQNLT